jgi:N-methylhydantoinase A
VLAALGLVVSPRRRDAQRSLLLTGDDLTAGAVADAVRELGEQARAALGDEEAPLHATYELRYQGQAFELAVPAGLEPKVSELRDAFDSRHQERYGYSDEDETLELVTVRVSAIAPAPDVSMTPGDNEPAPERTSRRAIIAGAEHDVEVIRGAPEPGQELQGPAIIELAETTVLVPGGWEGSVHESGTIVLDRSQPEPS